MSVLRPLFIICSFTLLVAATSPVLAQSDVAAGVTTGDLNLREGPGTGHRVITIIPAGASVEVISCERWCELRYGGSTGWASGNYIEITADAEAPQPELTLANVEPDTSTIANDDDGPLTEDELEVLVAPIALYPDELVALVIAASLYPVDIVQGARFLEDRKKDPSLEPSEDWDGSVVSLLNYPDVVKMMNDDLEWTQMLGNAAVNQQKDLLVAIQQLRDQAVAKDMLKTTEQVVVSNENDNVVIQSADPEVVYVPQYEPQILYDPTYVSSYPEPIYYSDPYPSYWYPGAGFWTGAITGAAFAAFVDWDDWGTWGGDVDIDVKRECDKVKIVFGDRSKTINRGDFTNIDRDKLKANRDALKNVDRSRIERGNIDRSQISEGLKQNRNKRVTTRNRPGTGNRNTVAQRPAISGNDVRKNIQSGLSQRQTPTQRPTAQRQGPPRQSVSNRAATRKPPSRPTASKAPNRSNKSVSSRKPGSVKSNRPSRPSSMGNPSRGKKTMNYSKRGGGSHGGGFSGGRSRGGGSFSRGGGGRSFGGGGGGRRR
jgi:uncharacterized membrane protein YgcG